MIKKLTTKQILEQNLSRSVPESMLRTTIMLHNIRSMHNVGSAFRTADAFGLSKIHLSGFTPCPPRQEISKVALGAEAFVDFQHLPSTTAIKSQLFPDNPHNLLIGVEQTDSSKPLSVLKNFNVPVCFAFGNEVNGLDDDILSQCDMIVDIPQYGHKHSLNVSVCVGITLFQYLNRQTI